MKQFWNIVNKVINDSDIILEIIDARYLEESRHAEIEEKVIIVTASKRDSTIKDLAFSVNAQTQEDIERAGATNIEEISRNIAGLTIQNLGPGQSQVAIRGISAG